MVHRPLMGGLLHLVQQEGEWAGPQPVQSPPVTAHPSAASVPTSYYSRWHYNCLCTLKPGTRRQSWIQHGGFCWNLTVLYLLYLLKQIGNKVDCHIRSTLLPVLATNRQQREFERSTSLRIRSSLYGAKATRTRSTLSTFNKVDHVEFNFVASVYRA